jgi:hypothetical protein
VAAQLGECTRAFAPPVAPDLGHRARRVIVQDRQRHATEERERRYMPVEERLGGLAWMGLQEAGIRLRQVQAQEVDLLTHAANHADRFVKIHLRMARRVCQRHERIAAARPVEPDLVLHHGISAGKAMLVAQPFDDSLGPMPLLHRRCLVRCKDRIDLRQQRPSFGFAAGPLRVYPSGSENRHIFATVSRFKPKTRAASRRL